MFLYSGNFVITEIVKSKINCCIEDMQSADLVVFALNVLYIANMFHSRFLRFQQKDLTFYILSFIILSLYFIPLHLTGPLHYRGSLIFPSLFPSVGLSVRLFVSLFLSVSLCLCLFFCFCLSLSLSHSLSLSLSLSLSSPRNTGRNNVPYKSLGD